MKKIVVLISGSGSNLQAIIDKCKSKYIHAEIGCVISNNPKAYGLERAKSAGIKTLVIDHKEYQSRDLFDNDLYKVLKDQNADLIVLPKEGTVRRRRTETESMENVTSEQHQQRRVGTVRTKTTKLTTTASF